MGCDIHMQVERRVNGKWERVEELPPRPCSWCEAKGGYPSGTKCWTCKGTGQQTDPFDCRNYTTFAVLADVRNDGYVKPICEPRGLPADCVRKTDEDGGAHEYGDHSFSWLTLAELQAYDWQQKRDDEGWVSVEEFKQWESNGRGCPRSWCGDVGGGMVEKVSNKDMRRHIANPYPWEVGKRFYTLVQWSTTIAYRCRAFLDFMETLSALGNPDDVRIVFGFDS